MELAALMEVTVAEVAAETRPLLLMSVLVDLLSVSVEAHRRK